METQQALILETITKMQQKINDQNNHIGETKREGQRKVKRQTACKNQEKED